MNFSKVDFSIRFGRKMIELQCPECNQIYHIAETDMEHDKISCWNSWIDGGEKKHCGARYFQQYQNTHEFQFVRKAIHFCKGEK